jgi:dATP pyrophosphohydrolase
VTQKPYKIPRSVLVVIHDPSGQVLLLERADKPGFWQSVTGSLDTEDEPPLLAAQRELQEETGLIAHQAAWSDWDFSQVYEIFPHWRYRYAPGVTHNTEHVFSVCVAAHAPVRLSPREHLQSRWLPWQDAAEACFSWSNTKAIRLLAERYPFPDSSVKPAPSL